VKYYKDSYIYCYPKMTKLLKIQYLASMICLGVNFNTHCFAASPEQPHHGIPYLVSTQREDGTREGARSGADDETISITLDSTSTGDVVILLPKTGNQPNSTSAAVWSSADTNNECVTWFYMKAFGCPYLPSELGFDTISDEFDRYDAYRLSGLEPQRIEEGALLGLMNGDPSGVSSLQVTESSPPCEILRLSRTPEGIADERTISRVETGNKSHIAGTCMEGDNERKQFWEIFKQLASTREGKILLYRLLIEIRRTDNGPNFKARAEFGVENFEFHQLRACLRSLVIRVGEHWQMNPAFGTLTINLQTHERSNVISGDGTIPETEPEDTVENWKINRKSISLYHELLHWYHALRAPGRMLVEYNGIKKTDDGSTIRGTEIHPLFRHYHGTLEAASVGVNIWTSSKGTIVSTEELRTIMGASPGSALYLQGDDMCENLYRCSIGFPLRIGTNQTTLNSENWYKLIGRDTSNMQSRLREFESQLAQQPETDATVETPE
jgi:hypothetical protein